MHRFVHRRCTQSDELIRVFRRSILMKLEEFGMRRELDRTSLQELLFRAFCGAVDPIAHLLHSDRVRDTRRPHFDREPAFNPRLAIMLAEKPDRQHRGFVQALRGDLD